MRAKLDFNFFDKGDSISLREGFGRALLTLAQNRTDFYLFDADVRGGTGAKIFAESYPDRVIQFGIAEQNVMAAAAGFADTGLIPLVVGFGAFTIMRAHEQLRTAVCYGDRNVKICCSHLGVDVGPDGATAQMLEDLATCRSIPGLTVLVPACANEIQPMLQYVINEPGPVYMRIGRSPTPVIYENPAEVGINEADLLIDGKDVFIIACGSRVWPAINVATEMSNNGTSVGVVNMRTIKPIDKKIIGYCCDKAGALVTVEDHNIIGGMGSAVAELVVQRNPVPIEILGIKDEFGKSGEHTELFEKYGISDDAIKSALIKVMGRKLNKTGD